MLTSAIKNILKVDETVMLPTLCSASSVLALFARECTILCLALRGDCKQIAFIQALCLISRAATFENILLKE